MSQGMHSRRRGAQPATSSQAHRRRRPMALSGMSSSSSRTRRLSSLCVPLVTSLILLLLPHSARGSDSLGAAALGAQAARGSESWHFGATMGTRGISYTQGNGGRWVFGAGNGYALGTGSFNGFSNYEIGIGWRLIDKPWANVWAGGSVLGSARAGLTVGARGFAGAALHFGDTWFVRPGVTVSLGGAVGPWHGAALLTPADAFVETGWHYMGFQPYVRAAVGVDPFAGVLPTMRAELSIGFAFTWSEETARQAKELLMASGDHPHVH